MSDIENVVIHTVQVGGGFFNTDTLAYPPDAMAPGSENVFITDYNAQRVFRGLTANGTGGRTMFNVAGGYASLNDVGATQGVGSVFNFINESMFAIGAGEVFYNGSVLVDTTPSSHNVVASSTLQLAPKVGSYTYPEWYTAGFTQPSAPTVRARAAVNPLIGLMNGTYSFKIAAVRSTTGARSIASVTSAVIVMNDETLHITFPAAQSNGQDRWAIFGTKAGFGGVGVHYLIAEIDESDLTTVDSISRSYVLEYNDSDLLPTVAFVDDYPPQAGSFAARLENYVLIIGSYTNAIQVSIRNFPESFHPEHLGFLPKTPTAVLADPQGSYIYVSTDSSVHAVSVVPSVDNPLIIQTLWSDVGVANSHNWCAVDGVLFAFTAKTGAVTMGNNGTPNSMFAQPVAKAMRNWVIGNVVVFHAPHLNSVIYAHGQEAYAFNLQNLKWSSPAQLNDFFAGNIVSAVVTARTPYITLLNGTTFTMYQFDAGAASTNFTIRSPDVKPYPPGRVNILGAKTTFYADGTVTPSHQVKIYTDGAAVADKTLVHGVAPLGINTTVKTRWYLPRHEYFSMEFSGAQSDFTKDTFLSHILVFGTTEESSTL